MVSDYGGENSASRERLEALAARLTDKDLSAKVSYGWTVSAALAHLAFWDNDYLALLSAWKRDGFAPPAVDAQHINDALRPLIDVIPGREAVRLAVAAAQAVDRGVEGLSPELVKILLANGQERALHRYIHRNEHLDDIERAVGVP